MPKKPIPELPSWEGAGPSDQTDDTRTNEQARKDLDDLANSPRKTLDEDDEDLHNPSYNIGRRP